MMRDVLGDIQRWRDDHQAVALATVVKTWGSAPRKVGSKMALTPAGSLAGSVSGGCVEGAVFEEGVAVLQDGQPRLIHYGVADETAWEVGLACGGQIEIFVEPLRDDVQALVANHLALDDPVAVGTLIRGSADAVGRKYVVDNAGVCLGEKNDEVDRHALAATGTALAAGRTQRLPLDEHHELFVDVLLPRPTLILVGGVHIAIALAALARVLQFQVVVIDPRRAFGSGERFPEVDQLIQQWPDKAFADLQLNQSTAVAMLTHDPKIDDPALHAVLNSRAFYIGALGSSSTQTKRRQRLLEAGFDDSQIARIHGPIGLDIKAQEPEEIALAIMAEIVAVRHGRGDP
jgi:xanthine dehydrogenase accessory factor